jgi:tetratricopeptide (TPR) repeat protein
MKPLASGVLLFLAGLAWVPAAQADEKADYQTALENYRQGQYSQAVIGFQNVIQEDPKSWQAYQGLGSAFLHEGDKDAALQAYQKSLQLNPDNLEIEEAVDKLSAEVTPVPQPTPSPAAAPSPDKSNLKLEPIGTFSDNNGKKLSSGYLYEGEPLENDQEIANVISPLKDPQADQSIRTAVDEQSAGHSLEILGGVACLGGFVYAMVAPGSPTTTVSPFGGTSLGKGQPNLTPSWIAGGAGVAMLLAGFLLEGDAARDRDEAVARYDQLVGPVSSPEADNSQAAPGGAANAPAAESAGPGASQAPSAPPTAAGPAPASNPSEGGDFGRVTVDISPLASLPLSGKTSTEYNPGFGFGGDIKLSLDKNWSVGVGATFQDLPVNVGYLENTFQQTYGVALPSGVSVNGDWQYIPIVGLVQYTFSAGKPDAVPYVFLGAGVALNSADVSAIYSGQNITATVGETDFLLCPGLGIQTELDSTISLFFQGRLDIDFTSQNNTDVITLTANGSSVKAVGNLSDDSPTIFLPIQLGVRF